MVAMRERGVKPGRKALSIPEDFSSVRKEIKEGKISQRAASKKLGVDRKTLKKWMEQDSETEQKHVQPIETASDERSDSRRDDALDTAAKKSVKIGKRGQAYGDKNAPQEKGMKTSQEKEETGFGKSALIMKSGENFLNFSPQISKIRHSKFCAKHIKTDDKF